MKRKIIALGLAAAMIAVAVVSGTLAYLTDSDEAVNVFAVGNVDISLTEDASVKDVAGNELTGRTSETSNGYSYTGILPSNKLTKEVTVSNDGESPAYVRVLVVMNNFLETWNALNSGRYEDDAVAAKYAEIFDGWNLELNQSNEPSGINESAVTVEKGAVLRVDYSYQTSDTSKFDKANWFLSEGSAVDEAQKAEDKALAKGQDYTRLNTGYYTANMNTYERIFAYYIHLDPGGSVTLFSGLNVPAEFDAEQLKMFEGLEIKVYADAIQTEGFNYDSVNGVKITDETEIAKNAFTALEEAHPMSTFIEPLKPAIKVDGTDESIDTVEEILLAADADDLNEKGELVIGVSGEIGYTTLGQSGGVAYEINPAIKNDVSAIVFKGTSKDAKLVFDGAGVSGVGAGQKVIYEDLTIVDESVSYNEGAWEFTYLEFAGDCEFRNCVFTSGVMFDTSSVKCVDCTFITNEDSVYAAWVSGDESDTTASFEYCTFKGTRGLKMHECYGSKIKSVTVDNCTFDNISKKPGIAIGDLDAATAVTITNSSFINCMPGDQGNYKYETDTDIASFTFVESGNTVVNG